MIPRHFIARLPFPDEFSKISTMQVTNYPRLSKPRLHFLQDSKNPRMLITKTKILQVITFASQEISKRAD